MFTVRIKLRGLHFISLWQLSCCHLEKKSLESLLDSIAHASLSTTPKYPNQWLSHPDFKYRQTMKTRAFCRWMMIETARKWLKKALLAAILFSTRATNLKEILFSRRVTIKKWKTRQLIQKIKTINKKDLLGRLNRLKCRWNMLAISHLSLDLCDKAFIIHLEHKIQP